ncbi:MAG TPA: NmrA/HSCARG family protein [Longimicrobiales bacterium]
MKKTILVIGATGAQGGSVARELLRRGQYEVRALTRTSATAEARALRSMGAEVVRGDLFDVESVIDAMKGCYGVFGVTSYWEHFEREEELGANLVDAAAETGIEHLVLSTLPPVHELTNGELIVPEFDLKARAAERARRLDIPTTFVQPAFYYENFTTLFAPRREADGCWVFGFPQGEVPLAGFAAEDTGGIVASLLERGTEYIGRTLSLVGGEATPDEYARVMSRVVGRLVRYRHVPREVFAAYEFRGATELADRFTYYRTRGGSSRSHILLGRELYPALQSFEQWAWKHLARLEQVIAA